MDTKTIDSCSEIVNKNVKILQGIIKRSKDINHTITVKYALNILEATGLEIEMLKREGTKIIKINRNE